MKIVVTGSLGNISKPLTEELIKKGHDVTLISSDPKKQNDIEALGAKAAIGKLENAKFLTETFTGADAVYCMTPFNFTETNQREYFHNIANSYRQAITDSGVKRELYGFVNIFAKKI